MSLRPSMGPRMPFERRSFVGSACFVVLWTVQYLFFALCSTLRPNFIFIVPCIYCDKFKLRPSGFHLRSSKVIGLLVNFPTLGSERKSFFVAPEDVIEEEAASGVCRGIVGRAPWHALAPIGRQLFWAAQH